MVRNVNKNKIFLTENSTTNTKGQYTVVNRKLHKHKGKLGVSMNITTSHVND